MQGLLDLSSIVQSCKNGRSAFFLALLTAFLPKSISYAIGIDIAQPVRAAPTVITVHHRARLTQVIMHHDFEQVQYLLVDKMWNGQHEKCIGATLRFASLQFEYEFIKKSL